MSCGRNSPVSARKTAKPPASTRLPAPINSSGTPSPTTTRNSPRLSSPPGSLTWRVCQQRRPPHSPAPDPHPARSTLRHAASRTLRRLACRCGERDRYFQATPRENEATSSIRHDRAVGQHVGAPGPLAGTNLARVGRRHLREDRRIRARTRGRPQRASPGRLHLLAAAWRSPGRTPQVQRAS
jgi:hypothetical protein